MKLVLLALCVGIVGCCEEPPKVIEVPIKRPVLTVSWKMVHHDDSDSDGVPDIFEGMKIDTLRFGGDE